MKQEFWKAFINGQRPKLKIQINIIEIEGLVDTGADIKLISSKSWYPGQLFQEVNVLLLGIGTLSCKTKYNMSCVYMTIRTDREIKTICD